MYNYLWVPMTYEQYYYSNSYQEAIKQYKKKLDENQSQLAEIQQKVRMLGKQNAELAMKMSKLKILREKRGKRKINRRNEEDISKQFLCVYPFCQKKYATDLALNLHIKIKHHGGNKKERKQYIKNFIRCSQLNLPIPQTSLNIPKQIIQEYKFKVSDKFFDQYSDANERRISNDALLNNKQQKDKND